MLYIIGYKYYKKITQQSINETANFLDKRRVFLYTGYLKVKYLFYGFVMKKITNDLLSIPPYISTSWSNISSLHVKENQLLQIGLQNGSQVEIPGLDPQTIFDIFSMHAKYLEQKNVQVSTTNQPDVPLRIGIEGIDNLGSALQHNQEQANTPDLPVEILSKIALIAKAVGVEDPAILPKPEPHCNCMHCQIARAIQMGISEQELNKEISLEEVSEEDLRFRTWDVVQASQYMYTVTNPLDSHEQYQVFLGEPIGCNCGQQNCEHIRAVLTS